MWLLKGLAELGVETTLVCKAGSKNPYGSVCELDLTKPIENHPIQADLIHYFSPPDFVPQLPYVVTIHGNGKEGEHYPENTIFLSRDHARRHGSDSFVYNGLDPEEYLYSPTKDGSLLFLGRASWKVKNVKGAIRIARNAGRTLNILGGRKLLGNGRADIYWRGDVGGEPKATWISKASGLIFPVVWSEPFGLAVIECLVSGTPVLATPFGALPEIVTPEVGVLATSERELVDAVAKLDGFDPERCRQRVLEHFHYRKMSQSYLEKYNRAISGERLNSSKPTRQVDPMQNCQLACYRS